MQTAPSPSSRDRPSRPSSRRRGPATALLLVLGSTAFSAAASAQTLGLRGDVDTTQSTPAVERPAVSSDLLGLGEVASPLDATTAATAEADAAPVAIAPVRRPRTAATRGPVAPVAPLRPSTEAAPRGPATATEPAPRDPEANKREEAETADDAYAPLGLRTGGMIWYPAIETSVARKTNVDAAAGGRGASFLSVQPELIGRSDWSRHSLELTLRGGRDVYPDASDQTQSRYDLGLRGRLDLGDETRADLAAQWSRQRESTSVNEASTAGVGTDRETRTLSLGVGRDVGLVGLSLRGAWERNDYMANGDLGTGAVDPAVQDNDRWSTTLRTTLGPTHTLAPFVEIEGSLRRYDQEIVYGSRRDGEGVALRTGLAVDAGPTLRGEISTGWGTEKAHDDALQRMSGWLVDGNLVWSPTRLIVVRTKLKTSLDATTNQGSPGTMTRTLAVDLDWALRRELTVSLGTGLEDKHYYGIDVDERTASLSGGLTWKFDRTFQVFTRARWDHVTASNAPAYDVGTFTTGVRVQR